jgi:hypothetical protein
MSKTVARHDPPKSPAQKRLMEAAAHTKGGYGGVPQAVGREFVGDACPITSYMDAVRRGDSAGMAAAFGKSKL